MNGLNQCLIELEKAGLDVFEVGCRWQEKTPFTLLESSEVVRGFSVLLASALLLYGLNELARDYFKPRQ